MSKKGLNWAILVGMVSVGLFAVLRARQPSATAAVPAPSILSVGSITQLDLGAAAPKLALSDREGRIVEIALDPNETVVMQGGKTTTLEHLEEGQQVKAYHTLKGDQEVATSIQIIEPEPMPPLTEH